MNEKLNYYFEKCKRAVFFGGAGMSTESGIPDFRGAGGLYRQSSPVPPEKILSRSFFYSNTGEFYSFYRKKMLFPNAKPNTAHFKLAQLEMAGKLSCVVTQNIDGLHQKARSEKVLELHGSIYRNYCVDCGAFYPVEKIINSGGIPYCDCGGIIKPDVVLYEEQLDEAILEQAIRAISEADLLIVGGTSLRVYPAAGLLRYFGGDECIIINKSATDFDSCASLLINEAVGVVFA